MQWCPTHELGWCEAWYEPAHWHPVPAWVLYVALAVAREFGCTDQIVVEIVACPQCLKQDT